jgi:hypothetical protein
MAGLDPAIHVLLFRITAKKDVEARLKAGHDEIGMPARVYPNHKLSNSQASSSSLRDFRASVRFSFRLLREKRGARLCLLPKRGSGAP